MTLAERFWEKVERHGEYECWPWLGVTVKGYGIFWVDSRRRAARAHRVAYELVLGPIPAGMTLDHLCENKPCVNPAHLDPCPAGENASRSARAPYNVKARATHCGRGHRFDLRNTAIYNGRRRCRACAAFVERERVRRLSVLASSASGAPEVHVPRAGEAR
jgi:hypothetical protein